MWEALRRLWGSFTRLFARAAPSGALSPAVDRLRIWRHRQLSMALPFPLLDWSDEKKALQQLYDYAVQLANGTIDWYIRHRFWKKFWSRFLRFFSFLLVIAAGFASLLKIFSADIEQKVLGFILGRLSVDCHCTDTSAFAVEVALVLIGLAGGFNLVDRLAGLSSGWMRYVSTAMVLDKELVKFQFEWTRLELKARKAEEAAKRSPDKPPSTAIAQEGVVSKVQQVVVTVGYDGDRPTKDVEWYGEAQSDLMLERIDLVQEFCSTMFSLVSEETGVWADELKENITKFTKDVVSHHGRDAGRS